MSLSFYRHSTCFELVANDPELHDLYIDDKFGDKFGSTGRITHDSMISYVRGVVRSLSMNCSSLNWFAQGDHWQSQPFDR